MEEQDTQQESREGEEESFSVGAEANVIEFLDSIDDYLILMNSLFSTLRQGWLDLASARHSMGASRVNTAFFDLKDHSAATTLPVHFQSVGSGMEKPLFSLCKWASSEDPICASADGTLVNDELSHSISDQAQKERLKLLSMFGTLVSPKLRSAQLSFETGLETIAEIANMRASFLSAYHLVLKEKERTLD